MKSARGDEPAAHGAAEPAARGAGEPAAYGVGRRALGWMRIVVRPIAAGAGSCALALAWFALLPFVARSAHRRRALRGTILSAWSRWCLACCGVRVQVRGKPPAGPCFLVANHQSFVDIWVLASETRCVLVSMAELARWPFVGTMARSLGTVFIDRQDKRQLPSINREIENWLDQGHIVALFPEGTSFADGRVHAFRPSLLEPAAQSRHPVAFAAITYATRPPDPPASHSVCWEGTPILVQAKRFLRLARVDATLSFGAEHVRDVDRKRLAHALQACVQAELAARA